VAGDFEEDVLGGVLRILPVPEDPEAQPDGAGAAGLEKRGPVFGRSAVPEILEGSIHVAVHDFLPTSRA